MKDSNGPLSFEFVIPGSATFRCSFGLTSAFEHGLPCSTKRDNFFEESKKISHFERKFDCATLNSVLELGTCFSKSTLFRSANCEIGKGIRERGCLME